MATFRIETRINAPREVVFDLARDIDFHIESVPGSNERAVAGTTSGLIGDGESVTWEATHFGIGFRMTSLVSGLDRPNRLRIIRHAGRSLASVTCTPLPMSKMA